MPHHRLDLLPVVRHERVCVGGGLRHERVCACVCVCVCGVGGSLTTGSTCCWMAASFVVRNLSQRLRFSRCFASSSQLIFAQGPEPVTPSSIERMLRFRKPADVCSRSAL